MFKAEITHNGFEEIIKRESVIQMHQALEKILQQLSIEYMPHHLGGIRRLQKQYKSFSPDDYKYMIAGKSIIKLSK